MSAVALQTPGAPTNGSFITRGDDQITFPAVYESIYKARQMPLRMFPEAQLAPARPMEGEDFQAKLHRLRQQEAHEMVRAKVHATRMMKVRANSSHQGYFGMPAPVLSQRVYANPTNGAEIPYSARQSYASAPFHYSDATMSGGVLRTRQGQMHGKERLMSRINQLDAIESAKQSLLASRVGMPTGVAPSMGMPSRHPTVPTGVETPVIELNLLLQSVLDATAESVYEPSETPALSQFSFKDTTRALELLFKLAPTMEVDELIEVYNKIANIQENLNAFLDEDRTEQKAAKSQVAVTMRILFGKAIQYVREMMSDEAVSMSEVNRRLLSNNLVKTLDFTKVMRDAHSVTKLEALAPDMDDYADLENIDDGDDDGEFTEEATARESSEAAARPRGQFDVDDRQVFGFNSGAYFGEPFSAEGESVYRRRAEPTEGTDGTVRSLPIDLGAVRRAVPQIEDQASGMRSRFDPDTQAFNVDMPRQEIAPSVAPTRPYVSPDKMVIETTKVIPEGRIVMKKGKRDVLVARQVMDQKTEGTRPTRRITPTPAEKMSIRSRDELPTTKQGYLELAARINALPPAFRPTKDGSTIEPEPTSMLKSIRTLFIRRLGL